MTKKIHILDSKKREITGKKVKILRKQGLVPAVVYGYNIKPINITLDFKKFVKLYKKIGESSLINLAIEGVKDVYTVIIKEVDIDFINRNILNIGFYKINEKEKIRVMIPVVEVGESEAEKSGAVIMQNVYEIPVKCFSVDIPEGIEVDITKLEKIGDNITYSDLVLSDNVELLKSKEEMSLPVVSAIAPTLEEEEVKETEAEEDSIEGEEAEGFDQSTEVSENEEK